MGTEAEVGPTGVAPGCPLDRVLGFLARSWMADIVYVLGGAGALHFSALRRTLPGQVSARVLALRVRELQAMGLVSRTPSPTGRREVHYALTAEGRLLDGAIRRFEHALDDVSLPAALTGRA